MHVVVTGASAGIGAALAREFGRAPVRLTLVARRKAPMEELALELPVPVKVVVADLSDLEHVAD